MENLRGQKTQLRVNCPDAISDIDALAPVQSQYAASPRILALLLKKAALLDPGRDLMNWYDKEFNPRSAEGVGLDVWGRIVGIGRKLWIENTNFFGFHGQRLENFDQAPFWIQSLAFGQVDLTDEAYRFLIFYKAAANIGESSMQALNSLLNVLFSETHGNGSCYVLETGPMHIMAVFNFYLTPYEQAMLNRPADEGFSWYRPDETFGFAGQDLQNFDNGVFNFYLTSYRHGLLNRPAGVKFSWFQHDPDEMFGFAGQDLQNFNNGIFTPFEYQTPA